MTGCFTPDTMGISNFTIYCQSTGDTMNLNRVLTFLCCLHLNLTACKSTESASTQTSNAPQPESNEVTKHSGEYDEVMKGLKLGLWRYDGSCLQPGKTISRKTHFKTKNTTDYASIHYNEVMKKAGEYHLEYCEQSTPEQTCSMFFEASNRHKPQLPASYGAITHIQGCLKLSKICSTEEAGCVDSIYSASIDHLEHSIEAERGIPPEDYGARLEYFENEFENNLEGDSKEKPHCMQRAISEIFERLEYAKRRAVKGWSYSSYNQQHLHQVLDLSGILFKDSHLIGLKYLKTLQTSDNRYILTFN